MLVSLPSGASVHLYVNVTPQNKLYPHEKPSKEDLSTYRATTVQFSASFSNPLTFSSGCSANKYCRRTALLVASRNLLKELRHRNVLNRDDRRAVFAAICPRFADQKAKEIYRECNPTQAERAEKAYIERQVLLGNRGRFEYVTPGQLPRDEEPSNFDKFMEEIKPSKEGLDAAYRIAKSACGDYR